MNEEITMGLYGTAVMGIEVDSVGIECQGGVAKEEGRGRCQCVGECRFLLCWIESVREFGDA